jgi:hypothetical protein
LEESVVAVGFDLWGEHSGGSIGGFKPKPRALDERDAPHTAQLKRTRNRQPDDAAADNDGVRRRPVSSKSFLR